MLMGIAAYIAVFALSLLSSKAFVSITVSAF